MKKLMVIAAIVCAAVAANAATFQWKTGTGQQVYLMNTTDRADTLTAILFNSSVVTQQAVLDAFLNTGSITSLAKLSSKDTTSAGALTASVSPVEYGKAGDVLSAYFAVIANVGDQDYIYISDIASAEGPTTGNGSLSYSAKATSQAAAFSDVTSFQGAGWYTQSVPEPPSGRLRRLGMAGLALQRKQA